MTTSYSKVDASMGSEIEMYKNLTRLSLEIASEMHPLYSSGHFLDSASISEAADVTTP